MSGRIVRVECAGLSQEDEQLLLKDLQRLFPEAESSSVLQLSEAPPSWVQLLADGPTWLAVFKIGATAYLAKLGTHMADSTWEARRKARPLAIRASGTAIAALQRLYSILRAQKDCTGPSNFMGRLPSRKAHLIIRICCLPPLQPGVLPGDGSCVQLPGVLVHRFLRIGPLPGKLALL